VGKIQTAPTLLPATGDSVNAMSVILLGVKIFHTTRRFTSKHEHFASLSSDSRRWNAKEVVMN
jgi:hypothetical protein